MKITLKLIVFIIFSISTTVSAQSKLFVEYDVMRFTETAIATLIADKTSSVYEEGLSSQTGAVGGQTNAFSIGGYSYSRVFQKRENPNTVYLETMDYSKNRKEMEFIVDEMPELNWDISGPEKNMEIQGFTCREAKVQFRGSVYIAYFTDEIPIPFGPWKFSGLPGLILKVYSKDNPKHSWEAAKIVYPYETTQYTEFDPSIYTLTLKDAVEKSDKYNEEKGRAFAAKSGDIYYPIPKHMRRQKAREVKYEWETW